jgi:NADH pyrophosphatase NudC (nudix superfamily)
MQMKYCPQCKSDLVLRELEGGQRRVCPDRGCGFVFWDNPIPVVAALVKNEDRYVIARNAAWPAGIFSLITGFVEHGESPQQAVVREAKEELGVEASIVHFLGLHNLVERNQLIIAFELEANGEISTNHELAEYKRLSPAELAHYDFSPLYITENIISEWRNLQTKV